MKGTQSQRILDHLRGGSRLTSLEALVLYGSLRLGARIYDLKRQGHDIKSEMIEVKGKHVAQYWMEPK